MFSRDELADVCRRWGGMLWLPAAIDGPKLLWALAGCESSFGANCAPRHEPYYHQLAVEGKNQQLVRLTALFGCEAHSSFGPWQELLVNSGPGTKPEDFANISRCAMEVVTFINRRILGGEKAQTIEAIAEAYNSGKWAWLEVPPGVERYAADCRRYYDTEVMPEVTAS